jgi:hypothetical protein
MPVTSLDRRRIVRRLCIAVGIVAPILGVLVIPPWLRIFTPSAFLPNVLTSLEAVYSAAFVAALVTAPLMGFRIYVGRGKGRRTANAARALLLCGGCLIAFAAAETTAALRLSVMHGVPSLSPGDQELPSQRSDPGGETETNVVVLGESSAVGMPFEKWLSVGKIVVWQLEQAMPTRGFHLELVAQRGDTLKGQYQKLASLTRRPDLLIVYCGHNEFANISWSRRVDHYIDERASFRGSRLVNLWARMSPLCRLIEETAEKYRVASEPPIGMPSELVDSPAYSDEDYTVRLADFQRRLDAIAEYGNRISALTVLVVPPANDAGFEPNRSVLPPSTTHADRQAFAREFLTARRTEGADPSRAVERYRSLAARQPGFAEVHYRLGLLLAPNGVDEEAYQHFIAARDLDGLPMRCLTSFQQVYRTVASRRDCMLVDGQALFHNIGPRGLLDDHLFHDAVHPSLSGHVALARGILEALHARRAFGWPDSSPLRWLTSRDCATHFGLKPTDWKSIAGQGFVYYNTVSSLRYDWQQRIAKQSAFQLAVERIAAGEPPEALCLPNIGIPNERNPRIGEKNMMSTPHQ